MNNQTQYEMSNGDFGDSFTGTRIEIENSIIEMCAEDPDTEQFTHDDFQLHGNGDMYILTESNGWVHLANEISE